MEEETKKEETQEEKKAEQVLTAKMLEDMTAPDLREIAITIEGLTGVHAMKKEELIKLIKEAKGIKDEEPVIKRKKIVKGSINPKELKKKASKLKKEKVEAITAKDKKKVNVLRRRINRLKKRAKKVVQA